MKRFRPAANPHLVRASGDRWLFGYADVVTLRAGETMQVGAFTLRYERIAKEEDGHLSRLKAVV